MAEHMDLDTFWGIIARAKARAAEEPTAALTEELARCTPAQIQAYDRTFHHLHNQAYRWDLWGAAYIREGGCSDDGFIDFRYALIAQGREVYEAALADPDSLADIAFESDEDVGYAAQTAYEEATGDEFPAEIIEDVPTEPSGEAWDFGDDAENARRLPRVTKRGMLL